MKRNKLPSSKLDIITPVLGHELRLATYAEAYPELREVVGKEQGGRRKAKLYLITEKTPLPARKAVEIIGYYFKREFGHDFPPYQAHEDGDVRDRIFLLTQENWDAMNAVGAIVFRWKKYTNAPEQLVLSWVWIHPFLRRQGILTVYWDIFRRLYGNFHIEPPYSKAMTAFLEKVQPAPTASDK